MGQIYSMNPYIDGYVVGEYQEGSTEITIHPTVYKNMDEIEVTGGIVIFALVNTHSLKQLNFQLIYPDH